MNMEKADKFSRFCDVLLRTFEHVCRYIVRRTHLHGAELVYFEVLLVTTDPFLREQDRARIVDHNPQGDN